MFAINHNVNKKAFSLVELSVVLTIIGITLGAALSLATKITEEDRIETTGERLDAIEEALAVFVIENGRLPCPANGELKRDSVAVADANFGLEEIDNSGDPAVCDSATLINDGSYPNLFAGVVPTKTLGISDDLMEDGWGWRITYVVDDRFANANAYHSQAIGRNDDCDDTTSSDCFTYFDPSVGIITINDAATGTPGMRTDEAVMVLISHGKNGHGAFLRHGSATRFDAGFDSGVDENESAEAENAALGSGVDGEDFDNVFVQKDATGLFDDIVRYKLKWQVANDAGGITDSSTCAGAENVEDANPDVICTGGTGTTCSDMATIVYQHCLEQE